MKKHSPPRAPLLVTSVDGDVMFWNHSAANLWARSEREVIGRKLATLNLPGLSGELLIEKTASVRQGRSEREWSAGVVGRVSNGDAVHIAVEVSRMRDPNGELTGLVYVAREVTELRSLEAEVRRASEERQCALEELHTLRQEMQSTNAELDATNRELAKRTEEMNRLTLNQRAIIRSLSSAVIVVDTAGKVTMWNLAAERLLGVTETQAVGHVMWTLQVPALNRGALTKLRKALSQNLGTRLDEISYELPGSAAGKAIVSAVPILDGGTSLGAVIIFDDVTRLADMLAEEHQAQGER